jgi:prepilin-type N-terminal cleavage/methylation domain-containing protein
MKTSKTTINTMSLMNPHAPHTTINRTDRGGFSLIELMVSLTIFSIVMTISISTLLVIIDANAKSQALYDTMTNVSFAVDSITRNLRTGHTFYCGGTVVGIDNYLDKSDVKVRDCENGQSAIVFTHNIGNKRMAYRLTNYDGVGVIEQAIGVTGEDSTWIPITSKDPHTGMTVDINEFKVYVEHTDNADGTSPDFEQPKLTVVIIGEMSNGLDTPTTFRLQSSVTPRSLDY